MKGRRQKHKHGRCGKKAGGRSGVPLASIQASREAVITSFAVNNGEAARLRDAIDTCRRFVAQQEFANRFAEGVCTLHCAVDGIEYRFVKGALAGSVAAAGWLPAYGEEPRPAEGEPTGSAHGELL